MAEVAVRIVPPAPPVHREPLPSWRLLFATLRNPLTAYSEESFELPTGRRRIMGRTSIGLNHPEAVRHVLTTFAEKYRRPAATIRSLRWMVGDGLLLSEGEAWRRQRKMLAPGFSPAHIGELLPHFAAAGKSMVARLRDRSEAKLSTEFNQTSLDSLLRALFSTPADTAGAEMADLVRRYLDGAGRPGFFDAMARHESDFPFLDGPRRRFRLKWFKAVDALVEARREAPDHPGSRDLLDILLAARDAETGVALPPAEVRDQAATMLFAGFETTTRLLSWAAYLLALDRQEQASIRAEIAAFPPEQVSSVRDFENWPRLRCALLETLRLYPPVPQLLREAVVSDQVMGEAIEPGDLIWISPWTLHRHREHWDQPTAFKPDRFLGQAQP